MKKEYTFNPDLPFVKKNCKGNRLFEGRFVNDADDPRPPTALLDDLKWKFESNPQLEKKETEDYSLTVIPNENLLSDQENGIVWLGHACFIIKINGITIITDPCLFDLPMVPRLASLPCDTAALKGIDYLLLSHGHRDHYDQESIKIIVDQNPDIEVLLPMKLCEVLTMDCENPLFQEAAWYQEYDTKGKDLQIFLLPAWHWNQRNLTDFNQQLWGGFWIKAGDRSIYFSGDTAFCDYFKDINSVLGPADICLLPVGAYKPYHLMKDSHMSPKQAVDAYNILEGKTFIPYHYGTYDLSNEPLSEPEQMLLEEEKEGRLDGLRMLDVGEEFLFDLD